MPDVKTVAIVGAGAGGLTAIKCCIDDGLSPTCFERSSELGGLWYYTPNPQREGRVCVAPTTTTNSSKELSAFSDFPFPKQLSNFMHHRYVKGRLCVLLRTSEYSNALVSTLPDVDIDADITTLHHTSWGKRRSN